MRKSTIKLTRLLLLAIVVSLTFSGCARTKPARKVEHSGFLGDYDMLERSGEKDEALYAYYNPKADWPSYSRILLDPVVIWRRAELEQEGAPIEDLQRLANNFYLILHKALSEDYEMVTEPGPRTLRIQAAFTSVEKSWAAVNSVTSVIPVGIVLSTSKDFITGKPAFVGEASLEIRVTDARTGELLFAGVDRRVGGSQLRASVDNWDDVNKIMEIWSKIARFRLCKSRGGKDCLAP